MRQLTKSLTSANERSYPSICLARRSCASLRKTASHFAISEKAVEYDVSFLIKHYSQRSDRRCSSRSPMVVLQNSASETNTYRVPRSEATVVSWRLDHHFKVVRFFRRVSEETYYQVQAH